MTIPLPKNPLVLLIILSLLAHLAALAVLEGKRIDLGTPVALQSQVTVELKDPGEEASGASVRKSGRPSGASSAPKLVRGSSGSNQVAGGRSAARYPAEEVTKEPAKEPARQEAAYSDSAAPRQESDLRRDARVPDAAGQESTRPMEDPARPTQAGSPVAGISASGVPTAAGASLPVAEPARAARNLKLEPPLRRADEFLAGTSERLTYRITLRGVPVGQAVLAARREQAGVRITLTVTSFPLITEVFPVDDEVETELIAGNYIVTKIRQHEGSYSRQAGYTLMLRERKAFAADRLRGQFVSDPLPREDVTDVLSGFYFLRNQPVQVGKSLLLQLYDSGGYAPTMVEVLRQELIRVPGLGEIETLVLQPHLKNAGFFRSTGPILIWLSADRFKVPVRMQTSIPLGTITAELVSSEVESGSAGTRPKSNRFDRYLLTD
jgi:hypothetical protein